MIEELGGAELLGYRELTSAGGRGGHEAGPVGGVRCGRPLLYPIPTADLPVPLRRRAQSSGGCYLGAFFAFDLDPLPAFRRYVQARFEVTLADPQSLAVRVDADGDALGVTYEAGAAAPDAAYAIEAARQRPGWLRRLAGRELAPRAWVTGVQSTRFGWVYDDPSGELLLPRNYGMHAVLEVPAGAGRVEGMIGVQVEVAAGRRREVSVRTDLGFAEQLRPAAQPAAIDGAAVRLCMAADVEKYSGRGNAAAERIQDVFVGLLARARRAAGIPDDAVKPQAQGDGQFTVLPVGIDESAVIPRLLDELDRALRELNASTADRVRMRVALHRGLVSEGANGWIGRAPIAVHRILDSKPLHEALSANAAADFVLGVPDVLYRDVFEPATTRPRSDEFTAMTVHLPEKGFIEHAWVYVR